MPRQQLPGCALTAMTVEEANSIVELSEAWIGWEMWEVDHSSIRLDGAFTLEQLQALVTLMHDGTLL